MYWPPTPRGRAHGLVDARAGLRGRRRRRHEGAESESERETRGPEASRRDGGSGRSAAEYIEDGPHPPSKISAPPPSRPPTRFVRRRPRRLTPPPEEEGGPKAAVEYCILLSPSLRPLPPRPPTPPPVRTALDSPLLPRRNPFELTSHPWDRRLTQVNSLRCPGPNPAGLRAPSSGVSRLSPAVTVIKKTPQLPYPFLSQQMFRGSNELSVPVQVYVPSS